MQFRSLIAGGLLLVFRTLISAQSTPIEDFFHPDSLSSIVRFLGDNDLKGRFTGSPGSRLAAAYIAQQFRKAGLETLNNAADFSAEFIYTAGGEERKLYNMVGVLPGKQRKDELIIFSAHYDHLGTRSTNPNESVHKPGADYLSDSIYNGANDNASGVSALLTIAKHFSKANIQQRTVLFIAFDAEELGMQGSSFFMKWLFEEDVKAVINIEMIGRGFRYAKEQPFITGFDLSNLGTLLNNRMKLATNELNKIEFIRDPYKDADLFRRSDNYSFARLGIPAHTIMMTSPLDKYYHSVLDEPSTLDYVGMSLLTRAIAHATEGLITGSDTPTRIRARSLR